jgi:hypothetical protein
MGLEYFIREYRIEMQKALKNLKEQTSYACCLFNLIFNPENGSNMFFRNSPEFHGTTGRYIPEDRPLQYVSFYTQAFLARLITLRPDVIWWST